jgi:branched-chain amino acid transport system ATP-binding protein
MAACLSVVGVSKKFGDLIAVDEVSFEIEEGEIFGLCGPNGAGKTTLFNMITGIPFHRDQGSILFHSEEIGSLPGHLIYRKGLARTFQQEKAFETLSVAENVALAAASSGRLRRDQRGPAVSEALEMLELGSKAHWRASSLHLYEKKRLMIATAIVSKPTLLLLDEPAAGLSVDEISSFVSMILGLNRTGISILVIEHVLPVLFGVSRQVMVMDAGRRIAIGTPEEVARRPEVIEAYLGEKSRRKLIAAAGA